MTLFQNHLLSVILFTPTVGALLLLFIGKERDNAIRWIANIFGVLGFLVSLPLWFRYQPQGAAWQFVEHADWIPAIGATYFLGVDGFSMLLVLLTTLMGLIAILSSWTAITERVKEFYIFMLVLQTGMIGAFVSLDFLLFFLFWEVMLVPMYFLIGIWGGGRRLYSAIKFFLYTLVGSVVMLLGILALYFYVYTATGVYTFDITQFQQLTIPSNVQKWIFLAFFLGFAVKVPMFPFHTWLPDAHTDAPTAGSVILAAVLLKMGTYGFLRFALPLFPDALERFLPLLSILALIGIIYGGLMALIQKDIKSLVAYSSVSHMGLIMLAVFSLNPEGVQGAIYQMLNHGLSTGALFLIVGILYERSPTRLIKDFGGVSSQMPVFSAFFLVCLLSSVGLPGLNGFVGEILCLFGIFKTSQLQAILAVSTVILAAAYLLWMYQRVMHGPITNEKIRSFKDMNKRELGYLVPIIIMMFWMGIYPQTFLRKMDASVSRLLDRVHNREKIFLRESGRTTSLKNDMAAERDPDRTANEVPSVLEEKR